MIGLTPQDQREIVRGTKAVRKNERGKSRERIRVDREKGSGREFLRERRKRELRGEAVEKGQCCWINEEERGVEKNKRKEREYLFNII